MRFSTYWRRVQARVLRCATAIGQCARLTQSPRRRAAFAAMGIAVVGIMAFFVASALGVLTGSPSKFEAGDGNMIVDEPGNTDWNCFTNFTTSEVEVGAKCGVTGKFGSGAAVVKEDKAAGTTKDTSWKSGQKQDTECPVIEENKNSGKDTFTNVATFNETSLVNGKLGETYLYGATIRESPNGDASENVELNHKAGTSTCKIPRTVGDKLIGINYTEGGKKVEFHVLTWITAISGPNSEVGENKGTCLVTKDKPPCWGATELTVETGGGNSAAEGKANQEEIPAKQNGINDTALAVGRFAEFGINLTKAKIIPAAECEAFPQLVWESRSSGSSFLSNPEDIEIEKPEIKNCGEIRIIKQSNPRGVDKVFSFTSTLPANEKAGGVACTTGGTAGVASNGNFCLNDKGNAGKTLGSTKEGDNSTGNTLLATGLAPNTYTITEGEEPAGFEFGGITCSGGSAGSTSTTGQQLKVELKPDDVVVCLFVNNEQFGALQIIKASSKPAATRLKGAKFSIKFPGGTTEEAETNENGEICREGLTELGSYSVKETKAPTGYSIDNSEEETVKVKGSSPGPKCSEGQSLTFKDTPLTKISVSAASEVTGGTKSTIECTQELKAGETPSVIGKTGSEESPSEAFKEKKPGKYVCTVTVDP